MTGQLLPGTQVRARGLRWEVVDAQSVGPQTQYRLRGLDGAFAQVEVDLLHPFDDIAPIQQDLDPERAATLSAWRVYHQAFLLEQVLGPDALLAVQPGRLRLEPYQLVPVLRALRQSRVRLLLADGVGLGKTIEAGLILTELLARRLAHRILIVSPAGPLLEQWQEEMAERFGLHLDLLDRSRLEEIRRGSELGANPFDHVALGLASIDFLKQERVLEQLERASYDVVVIDEAHHCTDAGGAGDREDSQRRRLAEVLARRCDALILVTATPHDGNDRSFASLCELLDPSLVDGKGTLRGDRYRPYVVRRLKKHIPGLFHERDIQPIAVDPDPKRHPAFAALQRGVLDLVAPELRRAFRDKRYSDVLTYIALLKRSVSTAAACRNTLEAVNERFEENLRKGVEEHQSRRQRMQTLRDYQRRLARFGVLSRAEEQEQDLLTAEDLAQRLADLQRDLASGSRKNARFANVSHALRDLFDLATDACGEDPKLAALCAEVKAIRAAEPEANILLYSEYTASQDAAAAALRAAGFTDLLTLRGEDPDRSRERSTGRFVSQSRQILLSTDAAAEGLNLQERCHHLIHLELPWNPNRLEQRNGRIDRYGQKQTPIIRYLYLRGTFEERILLRLIAKYENQRKRLTFVPNTLGLTASSDAREERLLRGFLEEDQRLFQDSPAFDFHDPKDDASCDEATRELLQEIDTSLSGFERAAKTHVFLGEAGLAAEAEYADQAERARKRGDDRSAVDLLRFVSDAVRLDGGGIAPGAGESVLELSLPSVYRQDLDQLPGGDAQAGLVRLTTRIEVTTDPMGRAVGFLGRAHPLVRRALDRVRNLSLGGQAILDQRVSGMQGPVPAPTLLYTFLGRVRSAAGRALERVLAVRLTQGAAPEFLAEARAWLGQTEAGRSLTTRGLWRGHFEGWAQGAQVTAAQAAAAGFTPLARAFAGERRQDLDGERRQHDDWLVRRAEELCGPAVAARQMDLLQPGLAVVGWQAEADPRQRLAGFASDQSQPAHRRGEAQGVLRLSAQREAALRAHLDLQPPEILPLGLLMILPESTPWR